MALEAGGFAEKIGNRYEANWVAYQLLKLLEEKISYVTVESIGTDEVGVDLIIGLLDGNTEHHQCKVGHGFNEHWTLSSLNSENILTNAKYQIQNGTNAFNIVSPLTCKLLDDLHLLALNSNGIGKDFLEFQIGSSQERVKIFYKLCHYLGLNKDLHTDLDRCLVFLQKFNTTVYIENKYERERLEFRAELLFNNHPNQLITFLKHYADDTNKLRHKITAQTLLTDLQSSGFTRKIIPNDQRITPIINTLNEDFINSITPHLIQRKLITRPELKKALSSISSKPITLIKAEAGMGKSAFLLELYKSLKEKNVITVPIRLDRKRPEKTLDKFGQDLGFPYSPILCLQNFAKHDKVVILLDQLDAIRWTASHSSNALEICQQMINQILQLRTSGMDISVIVASRNFDTQEDIALSNWLQSIDCEMNQIELKIFEENDVKLLIAPWENYDVLNTDQKQTLRIPLWLSIYITIAEHTQDVPKFSTKLDLIQKFISDRLSLAQKEFYISEEQSSKLIRHIVNYLDKAGRLTIPFSSLPTGSEYSLNALISVGIFSKEKNNISFRHQAIYDYEIGYHLFSKGLESPSNLIDEIGSYNQQTLLKREHLRYALSLLLDSSERHFCDCAEAILFSSNIRFHLKSLTLNSLKNLEVLRHPSKKLVNKLLDDQKLHSKFIQLSCHNAPTFIQYLSESGKISLWLQSGYQTQDQALKLLQSIAEKKPDIVIKELKPYIDQSSEWNQKIYNTLCWKIENDSDEMFEVRKHLIQSGCSNHYVFWKELCSKYPFRALDLLSLLLNEEIQQSFGGKWSDYETESIENLVISIPAQIIERFLPVLDQILDQYKSYDHIEHTWFHEYSSRSNLQEFISKAIFSLLVKSSEELSQQPECLFELLNPFKNNSHRIFNHIYAKMLLNLSPQYADEVIAWLLQQPSQKFRLGNTYIEPIWLLSGKLIKKFSPHCTDNIFKELETKIYFCPSDYDIEQIKWRLKATQHNYYCAYWGQTQYFLLPQLDTTRVSEKSKELIKILNRKFINKTEGDFCDRFNSIAIPITSPIKKNKNLSNKAWKKLLLTPSEQFNPNRFRDNDKDYATEASIHQFSYAFRDAVIAEPIRFAKFSLKLSNDLHQNYIDALYSGLRESDISKVPEDHKATWQACPIELIEQVLDHFSPLYFSQDLQSLLSAKVKILSDKYLLLLENIAQNAKNPESSLLNINTVDQPYDLNLISSSDLYSKTINSIRGSAYISLSHKFWDDEEYALSHKYLVDTALQDEHPAVRMATIHLLLPLSNYDRHFSFRKFLKLCQLDIRNTLSHGYYYYFNNGFTKEFRQPFTELVLSMLVSPYQDVQKEASKQIIARWLFNDLFKNELNIGLKSDNPIHRVGYASVINQLLADNTQSYDIQKIEPIFEKLINCADDEVLKQIGTCFGNIAFWQKKNSHKLFEIYINSKALAFNLYNILHYFEDSPTSLEKYSNLLFSMIEHLIAKEKSPLEYLNSQMLIKIVQRIYDEAIDNLDDNTISKCLDMWDHLLASDLTHIANMTEKLDKGLMS